MFYNFPMSRNSAGEAVAQTIQRYQFILSSEEYEKVVDDVVIASEEPQRRHFSDEEIRDMIKTVQATFNKPIDFSDLENLSDLESGSKPDTRKKYPCIKCGGTGVYRGVRVHQEKSKCFACNGRGYFLTSEDERRKARQKAKEKKEADRKKVWADFKEQYPELSEWMTENMHWNDFARDIIHTHIHDRGKFPTENQINALYRIMAKTEETRERKAKERQQRIDNATVLDLARINQLFHNAHESGNSKPRLRVSNLAISEAPATGKNPGFLYVNDNGDYAGKISPEGKWLPMRSAREEVEGELLELAKDPMAAVVKHGRVTGQCACCGRELTNPESIERGVGPICADNWGL